MAVTFTRAIPVATGEAITSSQYAALARAINDRRRSGLADCDFRLGFYLLSHFRQLRNPDSSGMLWAPIAEFFEAYQMSPHENGDWPLADAGMPEGANVSSPLGAFVFGNAAVNLYSEAERISDPVAGGLDLWINGGPPGGPRDFWELGKAQRGAFDPDTGACGCPAFTAARSYFAIAYSLFSPHGNSYGSWLPTPELVGFACDDPDWSDSYGPPPNLEIKFTALVDGLPDLVYDGTCQPGPDISPPDKYDSHVAWIGYTPWAYYVCQNSGDVTILLTNQYLEGPYEGAPKLSKRPSGLWERVFHRFASEFRGRAQLEAAESEISPEPNSWNRLAFDAQAFFESQYVLAPQRGHVVGDGVTADYAMFTRTAGPTCLFREDTLLNYLPGDQNALTVHWACHCIGGLARAWSLAAPVTVQAVVDGEPAEHVPLLPDGEGYAEALWKPSDALPPGSRIQFRVAGDARFTDATGRIEVEVGELYTYKPWAHDYYLILRLLSGQ